MADHSKSTVATIIPNLTYKDAPAAIDWLEQAFGFTRHMVVPDGSGLIAHAQLKFGNGVIMLSSDRPGATDRLLITPAEAGGPTQALYVVVVDADAHCAQAQAAGARIIREPADQPYGGRVYVCEDLESNVWSFGTYDPWD